MIFGFVRPSNSHDDDDDDEEAPTERSLNISPRRPPTAECTGNHLSLLGIVKAKRSLVAKTWKREKRVAMREEKRNEGQQQKLVINVSPSGHMQQ